MIKIVTVKTSIDDKYSTIEFKRDERSEGNLYNSKLEAGNTGDLNIRIKILKSHCTSSGILTVNGYNDKYNITT